MEQDVSIFIAENFTVIIWNPTQIKSWSLCMCIGISAQKNRAFRLKKGANGHFSVKKDGAKPDTVFCKRHRPNKITA